MSREQLRRFILAAEMATALGLFAGVGIVRADDTPAPPPAAPKDDQGPTKADVMDEFSHMLDEIGQSLGGFTDDEKTKLDAVKKSVSDELDAHPDELSHPGQIVPRVMQQIRDALTPEHQKKFDEIRAERNAVRTGSNLHQLGLAMIMYANAHKDAFPPDLGTLATDQTLMPPVLLIAGSTTKPPEDWAKMDAKAQADWVNAHTDFVYLGAGKADNIDANFILAYVKPEASKYLVVLHADGSVVQIDPAAVDKTLAELKAGTNPPPSAKAKESAPPPRPPE